MDNETAQSGITIWNALLIAGIPGIVIAIVGAYLNHRNSLELLDKKLKTDLDLKKEEFLLEQKREVWLIKFDLFKRLLNSFRESVTESVGTTIKYSLVQLGQDTYFILVDCIILFNDADLNKELTELTELINDAIDGEVADDFHKKMGGLSGTSLTLMKGELGFAII